MEIPPITTLAAAQAAVNGIRSLDRRIYGRGVCGSIMRLGLRGSTFRLSANEGSYSECVALVTRGWNDHTDPNQCDALLLARKNPQLATYVEIPLLTTLTAAQAAINGIRALGQKELTVRSLQEHYAVGAAG